MGLLRLFPRRPRRQRTVTLGVRFSGEKSWSYRTLEPGDVLDVTPSVKGTVVQVKVAAVGTK